MGERVAQGRVAHRTYERGERGQDGCGQQDGEYRRGEQKAVSPHPQKDETRHLIPQPRKHRMRTPPGVPVMLSEATGSGNRLPSHLDAIVIVMRGWNAEFRSCPVTDRRGAVRNAVRGGPDRGAQRSGTDQSAVFTIEAAAYVR
ncbi:hypothetical protein SCMC78_50420 [Streptomyces sp. CMC78]|uniref:Uncharacterized protein n=1 Tax=Streptomyces sp. CMC78 TaxID=3231512 RepID=A0AB33KLD0_9ACTN